jgi:hypothetical protein
MAMVGQPIWIEAVNRTVREKVDQALPARGRRRGHPGRRAAAGASRHVRSAAELTVAAACRYLGRRRDEQVPLFDRRFFLFECPLYVVP